jgi:hypothetical protein
MGGRLSAPTAETEGNDGSMSDAQEPVPTEEAEGDGGRMPGVLQRKVAKRTFPMLATDTALPQEDEYLHHAKKQRIQKPSTVVADISLQEEKEVEKDAAMLSSDVAPVNADLSLQEEKEVEKDAAVVSAGVAPVNADLSLQEEKEDEEDATMLSSDVAPVNTDLSLQEEKEVEKDAAVVSAGVAPVNADLSLQEEKEDEEDAAKLSSGVAPSPQAAASSLDAPMGSAWSLSMDDWKETRTSSRLRKKQRLEGSSAVVADLSLQEADHKKIRKAELRDIVLGRLSPRTRKVQAVRTPGGSSSNNTTVHTTDAEEEEEIEDTEAKKQSLGLEGPSAVAADLTLQKEELEDTEEEEELEDTETEEGEDTEEEEDEDAKEDADMVSSSVALSPQAATYPLDAPMGSAWSLSMDDWKETRTSSRLRKKQSLGGPSADDNGVSLQEDTTGTAPVPHPASSSSPRVSDQIGSKTLSGKRIRSRRAHIDKGSLSLTTASGFSRKAKNEVQRMWTEKEDQRLTESVQLYGKDWAAASRKVQNRTNDQCRQRWLYRLDPDRPKKIAAWTEQEDKTLLRAVEKYGKSWQKIAETALPGRTNVQCQKRWMYKISPDLDRSKYNFAWTKEEDKKLMLGVQEYGAAKWDMVAAKLPGRTRLMCQRRWVYSLDPNIDRSECTSTSKLKGAKWTPEEDKLLLRAVQKFGKDKKWRSIALTIPDRTREQCRLRYMNYLDPDMDRSIDPDKTVISGKWSAEEDEGLASAVLKYGSCWEQVSAMVPGRSGLGCRGRWINHLDPNISRTKRFGTWTAAEDKRLVHAMQKHGKACPEVVEEVASRSYDQCRKRWSLIQKQLEH